MSWSVSAIFHLWLCSSTSDVVRFFFRSRVIWRAIYRAVAEHRAWCCCCCCSSYLSLPLTAPALVSPSLFPLCFLPAVILFFLSSPSPRVFLSGFPSVPRFFFFSFILSLMWIIDQHRSEVIAYTAVNPGSWIGCGSPRLDFDWRRPGGLLHDGSKGKETQTHVREFSGLCILDWLKQLLRSSNPCASTNTSRWLQWTFQKPV